MKKGFTLIELLVVVLIIGILSAVALPQYQKAVEKTKAAEAMILIRAIADANRRYYLANGTWAMLLSDLDIEIPGAELENDLGRVETKHFRYGAEALTNTIAVAIRRPYGETYSLHVLADQEGVWCYPDAEEYISVCKMLGATDATNIRTLYRVNI